MELVRSLRRRWLGFSKARWVRRSLPTLGTTAAFLVSYAMLQRLFGLSGANVFVLVPIVVSAWSFGLRGGLIGGVVVVALAAPSRREQCSGSWRWWLSARLSAG